jgi:putative PIN family toxin of toxin-antitoxin system
MRVVFDTNVVLSALVFRSQRLKWLRRHWLNEDSVPLISLATEAELRRVFAYPKFKLTQAEQSLLLAEYLSFCNEVDVVVRCPVQCRDREDQVFLDLCESAGADVLVTGDADLLALAGKVGFVIETPEAYRLRFDV